jgi:hypothetical protein
VNFSLWGLGRHEIAEERDKLFAGVSSRCLPEDLARFRIEGGVQRERAVPEVFESVTFDTTGRERKHRIQPIESLDGSLLVNTEDRCVLGWIYVEPDDVGCLRLELRII